MLSLEELKQINIDCYNLNKNKTKYTVIKEFTNKITGLNCYFLSVKGNNVLCFVGSHGVQDIVDDYKLFKGQMPVQAKQGLAIYKELQQKYSNILVTGHSLGGSVAQVIGATYGCLTYCFSPFGMGQHINKTCKNIINYGVETDIVYMINLEYQIGEIFLIESDKTNSSFFCNHNLNYLELGNKMLRVTLLFNGHLLQDYPAFSKAKLVDQAVLQKAIVQHYCKPGYVTQK